MCFEADDYAEFYQSRVVTARKPHRCSACRREIGAGEKYQMHSGKFDGAFFVEKVCRRCSYDIVRVVEHELAEGCHWSEAWPPVLELVGYLRDSDLGQTAPEDVPTTFNVGDMPKEPARV